ncbi:MAG: hypothetical protein JSS44_13905 [Proteobacteria bacterium]|nr:hypothetical protein [Pseudomonadota bacterium]MBS0462381.1 hypothetical protein [Pseudomonadota bacterium]MBS0463671.1 hypothetical protein [Pseudomonadota bacterium]
MRKAGFIASTICLTLSACSHIPLLSKPAVTGNVVGIVEYDTGLTKFSTVTGTYHQDMCSKASGDAAVHLSDKQMKKILALADKEGFYKVPADLTTVWPDPALRPPHCANFRLRIAAGDKSNEVRWDCGADGSNAPPPQVAPLVESIQQALRSNKSVREMPWSSCAVGR